MLNKKLINTYYKKYNLKKETIIFCISSILFLFYSLTFKDIITNNITSALLLFFVTLFGLPHGALDTLIAKKYKLYKTFSQFLLFNISYIFLAFLVFIIWIAMPVASLLIFLLISGYHFSEDWNEYKLHYFYKITLGLSIINFPLIFHTKKVENIYYFLTKDVAVYDLSFLQVIFAYINLLFFILLLIRNYTSLNICIQCIIILSTSFLLDPIFFFICYFCFFHSLKNYKYSVKELKGINKNKIRLTVTLNTIFSIFTGIVIYFYILNDFNLKNISALIFIGLAALTVPHMILRLLVNSR
ncbi:MAG: hypothetical protein CMP36_01255 [Rickettsiales bacterium]|nr:hypothetical protein [Rickettsiales bacterium]OUV82330.1 MAG: hypothetical protein CBC91_01675 [Rickettsiales bacterium TMED131]|tara:strand:+ start:3408 stop:4307 length:900 start_codon:yes stop_codon:yes gene_type:complete